MRVRTISPMTLVTRVVTCVCLVASPALAQTRQPGEDDFDWLEKHGWEVLDSVLPITATDAAVVFRSYRDLYYDLQERHFRVVYDQRRRI